MEVRVFILLIISMLSIDIYAQSEGVNLYNWERSSPMKEGIPSEVLDSLHQDILEGKYGLIDQLLVVKNGKLVFDEFYPQDYETIAMQYDTVAHQYNYDHPDWHPYYRDTRLHSLQSVTKSVFIL